MNLKDRMLINLDCWRFFRNGTDIYFDADFKEGIEATKQLLQEEGFSSIEDQDYFIGQSHVSFADHIDWPVFVFNE